MPTSAATSSYAGTKIIRELRLIIIFYYYFFIYFIIIFLLLFFYEVELNPCCDKKALFSVSIMKRRRQRAFTTCCGRVRSCSKKAVQTDSSAFEIVTTKVPSIGIITGGLNTCFVPCDPCDGYDIRQFYRSGC
jgi:hypothetical protein